MLASSRVSASRALLLARRGLGQVLDREVVARRRRRCRGDRAAAPRSVSPTAAVTSSDVTSTRIVPGMNFCRLALDLRQVRRDRHEHDVVVVVAARATAPWPRRRPPPGTGRWRCARSGRSGSVLAPNRLLGDGLRPARRPWRPRRRLSCVQQRAQPRRPVADLEELGRRAGDGRRPVAVFGDDLAGACGRAARRSGRRRRRSRMARRSSQVSVGSVPAPALRAARRLRARRHDQHVGPHRRERLLDAGARPLADRDHRDHGRDADDDAQRGQQRPHLVAQQRAQRDADDVSPAS